MFAASNDLPNAFVVSRVDLAILVNGVDTFDNYFTPPPNAFSPAASAHWPSTVKCAPTGPPCNVVASPAVLALENLAVFYIGWAHGDGDPNGLYVFKYTVHGTLNGTPLDLVATSLPILMTS